MGQPQAVLQDERTLKHFLERSPADLLSRPAEAPSFPHCSGDLHFTINLFKSPPTVRAQADSTEAPTPSQTTTSSRGRKKKTPPEYISDDLIEDALLSLQIRHKVLIHHTASLVESAEWISIFTQHISTIPYRLQKMNLDTSFCMESGQVRAGEDAATRVRMAGRLKLRASTAV